MRYELIQRIILEMLAVYTRQYYIQILLILNKVENKATRQLKMLKFKSRKRMNNNTPLLLKVVLICIALIIVDLLKYAAVQATECFPLAKSKLPKVNRYKDQTLTGFTESFEAVVGTDDFIIYGGRNYGVEISTLKETELSILARMDLSTNIRRWSKTFDVKNNEGRMIWALALNPSNEKIAVHAFKDEGNNIASGREQSKLWILNTDDGSYFNMPTKIRTFSGGGNDSITSSSAMFFSQHEKVIMAFERGRDITAIAQRLQVLQVDVSTRSMDWHKIQDTFYGRAAALAVYDDTTQSNSHIYLGGGSSSEENSNESSSKFAPAIFHLNSDGVLAQDIRLFRVAGSSNWDSNDEEDYAKVDHLKLSKGGAIMKIFGTTRSSDFAKKGTRINVFVVTLQSNFDLNDVEIFKELDMPEDESFITGIYKTYVNEQFIHLTYFVPSTKSLYYMKFDSTNTVSQTAVLLYDSTSVANLYIRETVFAGTRTGSVGAYTDNSILQAYSVGSSTQLKNASNVLAQQQDSSSMGIVLPSLREETCLKILEGTVNINTNDQSSETTLEMGTQTDVLTSMVNNDQDYQTTGINLNIGDIITEDIENDDWCTDYDYDEIMMTIQPGQISASTNICGIDFDDIEQQVDIVLPSITSPDCSDNGASLWSGYLATTSSSFEQDDIRINLNLDQSFISIRGITGGSISGTVSFTAHFTLPNGATSSFPFNLSDGYSDCVITQPSSIGGQTFTYLLGGTTPTNDGFSISSYSTTGTCNTMTYTNTVTNSPANYDDSMVINAGLGFTFTGLSNLISNVGTYTLNVLAQESCTQHSSTYTLEVISCATLNTVSHNYSGAAVYSYTIGNILPLVTWDAFTTDPLGCATTSQVQLNKNISEVSDSGVLLNLFTIVENTNTSGSVDISSLTDLTKGGTVITPLIYSVEIMVQATDNQIFNAPLELVFFNIEVIDPCYAATIGLDSVVPVVGDASLSCNIANDCFTSHQLTFDYLSATDNVVAGICPNKIYTLEMQDGSSYDTSIFDFNSLTGVLTIQNTVQNDFTKIQKYSMNLSSKFDDMRYQTASSLSFEFEIYCDNGNFPTYAGVPLPQIDYTLTQGSISTTLSQFISQCPVTYTHQVRPDDLITTTLVTFDPIPRQFTFYESQITANMKSSPYYEDFEVDIIASTTLSQEQTESFTLRVHNPCIDVLLNQITIQGAYKTSYDYKVGQESLTIDLSILDFSSSFGLACGGVGKSVTTGTIDDFITFDSVLQRIQIETQNNNYGDKSYTLQVDSYLFDYPQVKGETITIELWVEGVILSTDFEYEQEIENSSPSTSNRNIELSSQVKLDYSKGNRLSGDTVVFVAQLSDKENDPFTVTFEEVEPFLRTEFNDGYISVTVDEKTVRNGIFKIPITVTQTVEEKQESELYSLEIFIEGILKVEEVINQPLTIEEDDKADPISIEISEITESGLVTIKFIEGEIDPVTLTKINPESLKIEIIAIDQTYVSQLLFVWQAVKMTSTEFQIQLQFDREAYVSQALTEKDTLYIEILKSNLFIQETTGKQVPKSSTSEKHIPLQIAKDEAGVIASMRQITAILEGGTTAVAGSNVAIQLLLGGSLAAMWGLVNSMQIISHFPLLVVNFPLNAEILYKILYSMANFQVVPEDFLQEQTSSVIGIHQDDDEEKDAKLMKEKISYQVTEQGNYDKSSIWINSFMALAILSCLVILSVFLALLRLCFRNCEKAKSHIQKMQEKLQWNSYIRLGIEQTLVVSISSLIKIYVASNFQSKTASIETSVAYISLTLIVLLAIIPPIFLHKRQEQLAENQHEARYGALLLDMDVKRFSPKLFQTFFILRRVILSIIIVFQKDYPWAQIIVTSLSSVIQLMFLLSAKPFIELSMNRLEIYREINVLLNSYFLFIFSQQLVLKPNPDYAEPYNSHIEWDQDSAISIADFEAHYDIAWGNIALIAQFIIVNLSLLIIGVIRTIYKKIKRACLKRTIKKNIEEHQSKIKLRNAMAQNKKLHPGTDNQLIQPADDNQLLQPANASGASQFLNSNNNNQQHSKLVETRFKKSSSIQQNNSNAIVYHPSPKLLLSASKKCHHNDLLDIISEVSEKELKNSSEPNSQLQISSNNLNSEQELREQIKKTVEEIKHHTGDVDDPVASKNDNSLPIATPIDFSHLINIGRQTPNIQQYSKDINGYGRPSQPNLSIEDEIAIQEELERTSNQNIATVSAILSQAHVTTLQEQRRDQEVNNKIDEIDRLLSLQEKEEKLLRSSKD